MLFFQNHQQVFALLLGVVATTTTTFAVTDVSSLEEGRGGGGRVVASSSGGIRGRRVAADAKKVVSSSFSFPQQDQDLPETTVDNDNRQLLTGTAEWTARCAPERKAVNTCVGNPRTPEACHNCLYAQSFLSTPNLIGCSKTWCGTSDQCKSAAQNMFNCGARIYERVPTPSPVAPVSPVTVVAPLSVVVPTAPPVRGPLPIDTGLTTCSNTVPISGDSCDAGVGNSFITCCYSVTLLNGAPPPTDYAHVCTCAAYENRYLCNGSTIHNQRCTSLITPSVSTPVPVVPAPTNVPVVVAPTAAPVPAAVVPAVPVTTTVVPDVPIEQGSAGCPPEKAENGASCAGTVPDDKTAIGCGYIEQSSGTAPTQFMETKTECVCDTAAVPSLTWACTFYTLETTTTPAPASPSSAVAPPVVVPGSTGSDDTIPAGCPASKKDAVDGASCAGTVPDDKSAIGCGYMEQSGTPPNDLTETKILCVCDKALESLTWACDTLETTTPAPASPSAAPPSSTNTTFCPPQENPPTDGSSCEGILPVAITEGTCTFSQSMNGGPFETKKCTCVLDNPVWSCIGDSFAPVPAPVSFMPAGQTIPTSSMPVPATTPGPPTETTQCPTSFPGDGTSCAGVLKGGLANASCNFSQTVTTNGVPVSEVATCGCAVANEEIWSCQGTISSSPPNATPAVTPPAPVPVVPAPTNVPVPVVVAPTATPVSVVTTAAPVLAAVVSAVPTTPAEPVVVPAVPATAEPVVVPAVPATTTEPVVPAVPIEQGSVSCPPEKAVDGASCANTVPDDKTAIGCGYLEQSSGTDPTQFMETKTECVCDTAVPSLTWACTFYTLETTTTPAPAPPSAAPPSVPAEPVVPAVPASTDGPVVVVVSGTGTIPAGCPSSKKESVDGASCAGTVPDDKSAIGCGYMEQSGTPPNDLTETKILCVCDKAIESLTWACNILETTTPAPAPPSAAPPSSTDTFCPPQEDPPDDGTSCEGILPVAITEGTCTFLQQATGLETKRCTCVLDNPVWSCVGNGSFSPVQAPVSLMPASQTQPTSSMPVPATPGPPTETTQCPPSFPGDGTSCAGVLKGGLATASCTFSQTVTTNGVPVSESATCGCAVASDELWTCEGTISAAPPNAVPVGTPSP